MHNPSPEEGPDQKKWEELYYAMWNGRQWSRPIAIAPVQRPIYRSALATDQFDVLHLLLNYCPGWGHDLYYRQAPARQGFAAGSWKAGRWMNPGAGSYMSDIGTHGELVHMVYDDKGADKEPCPTCADVYYRRSFDRGSSWTEPVSLRPSTTGSSRPQLKVDRTGTVYVAWDEGWDRWSGRGKAEYGVFTSSADGGDTWTEPLLVSYPNSTNLQLSVGANGYGGVMLVWRTAAVERSGIYYQWSADWGVTWSAPETIPALVARPLHTPFDVYDMAADDTGRIHLVAVGRPSSDAGQNEGLYHLVWDGRKWSDPSLLYRSTWYPEYPHVIVDSRNELHATWFIRADPTKDDVPHQIWYAHGVLTGLQASPPSAAPRAAQGVYPPAPMSKELTVFAATSKPEAFRFRWEDLLVLILSVVLGGVIVAAVERLVRAGWIPVE